MAKAGKELYVGKLSYDITEYELEKMFAVSGTVTSIHLITDPVTGEFKGCGYIRMSTEAEAKDAIDSLDGAWLLDSRITVSLANPQKMKPGGGGAKFIPKRRGAAAGDKPAAAKPATAKPSARPAAAKPGTAKPSARPAAAKPAAARPSAPKSRPARPTGSAPDGARTETRRPSTGKSGGSRGGKR